MIARATGFAEAEGETAGFAEQSPRLDESGQRRSAHDPHAVMY
jgi:hypothetical protein